MKLDEFQDVTQRMRFSNPKASEDRNLTVLYPVLGLSDKAGRISNTMKKAIRDNEGIISFEETMKLGEELSDMLWYVTSLAQDIGFPMSQLAKMAIEKQEAKLHGKG